MIELTPGKIEQLYSEPSVKLYRPEAVLRELADGSMLRARCFNLTEPPAPEERNPECAAKLPALAQRLGLPDNNVSSID